MTRVLPLILLVAASCAPPDDLGRACSEGCDLPAPDAAVPDGSITDGDGDGGSDGDGGVIDAPREMHGLCVDVACTMIAPEVLAYDPRWDLYSDGAVKRRWIYLPPGEKIDTSLVDWWKFPVGTKLWKEFVRDGVRVETRYLEKTGVGDEDWTFITYAWSPDQTTATAVPLGQQNVNGTQHDIPPAETCRKCHANTRSYVLGFSAFQLDYDAPAGNVDLDDAIARGWLSSPPSGSSPHYPVPGNAQQQAALGYLHANCGHCHNSKSQLVNRPSFRIESGFCDTLANTKTYRTAVNVAGQTPFDGATIIAKPGDPARSIIITRMLSTNPNKRMPWLGGELADPAGLTLLRGWITNL
ncbi:MAG: hypothetical protein JWP01_626 [Myxococcales bacterium]|nr:hypothetical protein [Myxococcales bacterium]